MALFSITDENNITNETKAIAEREAVYNGDIAITDVIKNIGGYKWEVDYYNTITTNDNFQSTFDKSVDTAIVEYSKINDLILTVESPLDTTKPEEMEGSAYIDANLTPRNGDVIVTKLIDGRLGLFTLTGITKNNYNLKDIFKVNYKLFKIIEDSNDDLYVKLKSKTAKELYFNKDYHTGSDKSMFTKKESEDNKTASEYIERLVTLFNTKIIVPDSRYTISFLNDDGVLVHDPYLENFVDEVIGLTSLESRVTMFGLRDETKQSILDLILQRSTRDFITTGFTKTNPADLGTNHILKSPMWSGLQVLIEPSSGEIIAKDASDNTIVIPSIDNENYIFSGDFYSIVTGKGIFNGVKLSTIENLIVSSLNNEAIDFDKLKVLTHSLNNEKRVDILYYMVPITIYLFRYYLSRYSISHV